MSAGGHFAGGEKSVRNCSSMVPCSAQTLRRDSDTGSLSVPVASAADQSPIYRALPRTGKFAAVPSSLEGKFFAESAEDAAQWGERLERAGNYRIVEIEFSTSVAENLLRWAQLDSIGPARYGELHQLQDAVVRLWRS